MNKSLWIKITRSRKIIIITCLFALLNFSGLKLWAQNPGWIVTAGVNVIDGLSGAYANLHPGDTVYLAAGTRDKLLIRNFTGAPGNPINFMNKDGIVDIITNSYYGISISNCRYIRFSGQGNNNFYGIKIARVSGGAGIGVGSMSSDFEIDHVSIENCFTEGIVAKTDPDCSFKATRNNFTQFNTSIHDNYIADVGNEGMYVGSSFYSGITLNCTGKDTVVMPAVLDNIKIYNNIIKRSGWDGIQVGSAPLHCQINNNSIINDSQAEVPNQMSGILIGGGSSCQCNNNLVSDGKGDGIENHGLGGNKIYNNVIVNAGRTFLPNDASQMKHGIFISDVSAQKDSGFCILFNDIINPKSDGIRFQSIKSTHNIIASNLIINPGNYKLYQTDNTSFTGKDAYVMIPDKTSDLQLKNNFFAASISAAGVSATNFSVLAGSSLINIGCKDDFLIATDFNNKRRLVGGLYDIGAVEYDGGSDTLLHTFSEKPLLFPNPAQSSVCVRYLAVDKSKSVLQIYTLAGVQVLLHQSETTMPGLQDLQINVRYLSCGLYLYSFKNGNETSYGKFIKL